MHWKTGHRILGTVHLNQNSGNNKSWLDGMDLKHMEFTPKHRTDRQRRKHNNKRHKIFCNDFFCF